VGLDNLQSEGGCNSGVECVAAFFERGHADGRRDPVGRRDDAKGPIDLGARREWVWIYFRHGAGDNVKIMSRHGDRSLSAI
jgi:hypothetical protein